MLKQITLQRDLQQTQITYSEEEVSRILDKLSTKNPLVEEEWKKIGTYFYNNFQNDRKTTAENKFYDRCDEYLYQSLLPPPKHPLIQNANNLQNHITDLEELYDWQKRRVSQLTEAQFQNLFRYYHLLTIDEVSKYAARSSDVFKELKNGYVSVDNELTIELLQNIDKINTENAKTFLEALKPIRKKFIDANKNDLDIYIPEELALQLCKENYTDGFSQDTIINLLRLAASAKSLSEEEKTKITSNYAIKNITLTPVIMKLKNSINNEAIEYIANIKAVEIFLEIEDKNISLLEYISIPENWNKLTDEQKILIAQKYGEKYYSLCEQKIDNKSLCIFTEPPRIIKNPFTLEKPPGEITAHFKTAGAIIYDFPQTAQNTPDSDQNSPFQNNIYEFTKIIEQCSIAMSKYSHNEWVRLLIANRKTKQADEIPELNKNPIYYTARITIGANSVIEMDSKDNPINLHSIVLGEKTSDYLLKKLESLGIITNTRTFDLYDNSLGWNTMVLQGTLEEENFKNILSQYSAYDTDTITTPPATKSIKPTQRTKGN